MMHKQPRRTSTTKRGSTWQTLNSALISIVSNLKQAHWLFMCNLISWGMTITPRLAAGGQRSSLHHAIKPSVIFGPFRSASCLSLVEVAHRRGQELVTGIAAEPYNGWTKQEGLMTYQPALGTWLLTCTLAWWNGRPRPGVHDPHSDLGKLNAAKPYTLNLLWDTAMKKETKERAEFIYHHAIR